jgi:uncharacterized protein (DUF1330 family)
MQVRNAVAPTREQFLRLVASPEDGPVVLVNLFRFRERAAYETPGDDTNVSGRDAYLRYSVRFGEVLAASGGRVLYAGDIAGVFLGEVEEAWHAVAIVEYPSRAVLADILKSPALEAIKHHRLAGIEGQINFETRPRRLPAG